MVGFKSTLTAKIGSNRMGTGTVASFFYGQFFGCKVTY